MKVSKKMFANYLGIHPTNIKPYYESYLEDLGLKRNYLILSDIARLDGVTIDYVAELMGVTINVKCDFVPERINVNLS
ncbi:MAG: hypothetical protein CMH44_04215 [Muricauda sp.]|nr:hypothetical protein [Allomuricauda sp.]|tara:strand:+ start:199 stop:432 length:234 start_codon:yes stop_codon:yes gene_type:complete